MLPAGRNGTAERARAGQPQLRAQGPAAPLGPAQVVTAGLLTLLVVWTLLGNALVCAAVMRGRQLRAKIANVFIASLAVSDLLVALLVMPWKAVAEVAGYWPFGAFCDVWVAFDIMCSTASILNLCVISVDRYCAISSPFRYQRRMSRRVAWVTVGLAWALAVLVSFIPVQLHWHRDPAGSWRGPAAPNGTAVAGSCDSSLNRAYAISSSLISFYIPVAVMLVTYWRIFRIARAQTRRIAALERAAHARSLGASLQSETKALQTLSVIVGVFVCCWLPFFVLNCMVPFCSGAGFPCVGETTFDVFVWCGWANSSLNPIIYAFNADFRRVFAQLLGCGRLCPGTAVQTVDLGHELTPCGQVTAVHREMAAACSQVIPNAVTPGEPEWSQGEEEQEEEEGPSDPVSLVSGTSPEPDAVAQSAWELDCEGEISLGRRTPFTPGGLR
ncbi:D(1B) dopamine receptor [Sorex araneus]|uniref:D(1B) dopamine receptor n=1 Tax=Sorex araneus TaxID=42254 RepID=UPI002433C6DD|nr:D(1B) dopamine receptor [Sorex araneus]